MPVLNRLEVSVTKLMYPTRHVAEDIVYIAKSANRIKRII